MQTIIVALVIVVFGIVGLALAIRAVGLLINRASVVIEDADLLAQAEREVKHE